VYLYLVRHAVAHKRDAERWPDDSKRPLTPEGEEEFVGAVRGLARVVPEVDILLSSPYERAWRTAKILTQHAGWTAPREFPALEPRAGGVSANRQRRGRGHEDKEGRRRVHRVRRRPGGRSRNAALAVHAEGPSDSSCSAFQLASMPPAAACQQVIPSALEAGRALAVAHMGVPDSVAPPASTRYQPRLPPSFIRASVFGSG
jgi:hypothetical protein